MSKWLEKAVFYEIYPQSFYDTNADGIGDINGIIEKLDYVCNLGCNAIWINPLFESPFGDAGYDVSDYYSVAPRYGTNEDLARLFSEAHKRGLKVLLDLVPGHTSIEHKWFRESMKAERNEYTDRYVWTNSIWEKPNMSSILGFSARNGVCAVNFFSHQPALNYGFYKPERPWQQAMDAEGPRATLKAMKDVMRYWLKMGCDGFRVDMAGSLVKNDEDGKGNIALWQNVRAFLDAEYPDAVLVSEWGEPDKSLLGGFHADFLLHFGPSHYPELFRTEKPYFSSKAGGNISEFVAKYKENYAKTSGKGLICIPSGNHDMNRMALTLDETEMKVAFAFLLSMPGAPFIYYGDEIGMRFVKNLTSVEGGYGRTGSRSPMQWDSGINAGFGNSSPEKLYIPLDPDPDRPTVEKGMADENSLYHEIKKLIAIRKSHPALTGMGKVEFIYAEPYAYPLAYTRELDGEKILVIINTSAEPAEFECDITLREMIYSFGGKITAENGKIHVPPQSVGFFEI